MTLEQRLERLERQNRWMRRIGAVGIAAVAVVMLVAQGAAGDVRDLEVRSLIVMDGGGKTRLRAGFENDGIFALNLKDSEGVNRIRFQVEPDGLPRVTLYGGHRTKANCVLTGNGLTVHEDRGWKVRARIHAARDEPASLSLHDRSETARLTLSASTPEKAPLLEVADGDGKVVWKAPEE